MIEIIIILHGLWGLYYVISLIFFIRINIFRNVQGKVVLH